jgi:hypothetical protein
VKLRAGEWSFNALFKSGRRELDAKIEALPASHENDDAKRIQSNYSKSVWRSGKRFKDCEAPIGDSQ